jgi:hypothetical protein
MKNYCAFSTDHKCIKWMDYELTRHELEKADMLCHGNRMRFSAKMNIQSYCNLFSRRMEFPTQRNLNI